MPDMKWLILPVILCCHFDGLSSGRVVLKLETAKTRSSHTNALQDNLPQVVGGLLLIRFLFYAPSTFLQELKIQNGFNLLFHFLTKYKYTK